MASGGLRYDFTSDDNLTLFENRTLRFVVVDSAGAAVTDFTGWTFSWFLVDRVSEFDGLPQLNAGATVIKSMVTQTAPNVDVPLTDDAADWPTTTGGWQYELWRTDAGQERRLAWGNFPILH